MNIRKCRFRNVVDWFYNTFYLLGSAPKAWFGMTLLCFALGGIGYFAWALPTVMIADLFEAERTSRYVLSSTEIKIYKVAYVIGWYLAVTLLIFLQAGMTYAAYHLHENGEIKISHLFTGFVQRTWSLAFVALLLYGLLFSMVWYIQPFTTKFTMMMSGGFVMSVLWGGSSAILVYLIIGLLTILLMCLLSSLVICVFWFTPILLMLEKINVWRALLVSFKMFMKNGLIIILFISVGLYTSVLIVFMIILPLWSILGYCIYYDIIHSEPEMLESNEPVFLD